MDVHTRPLVKIEGNWVHAGYLFDAPTVWGITHRTCDQTLFLLDFFITQVCKRPKAVSFK